ncbi:MAG: adenylate/guanylate cyclase domain-containing protein, partial [Sphaerospermopsis sp. SIO1G2]|nr:adenylate/guanylate cyclase domain-containing protein [Sphaerospermopsis sp. SIO1G2]
ASFPFFNGPPTLSKVSPPIACRISARSASDTPSLARRDLDDRLASEGVVAPMEIFSFLNDYLACMGQAIDETGGFIDKYIGDAIMALFDDESTDSALNAAIAMQKSLDKFNNLRLQKNLPNISVGIGIHRGTVVMGTVGFTSRMDSTVIGDAVNVASRIEELTKQYNCEILITESVVNNLSDPESFSLRLVNESVKVKGKDKPIAIYELKVTHQL